MTAKKPRIFSVSNQKGGVGKTTTSINLATAIAAIGRRVLLIDFDAQGNASTGLGISPSQRELTSYDVVTGAATLAEARLPTDIPRLHIVAGDNALAGVEIELSNDPHRSYRLRNAIRAHLEAAGEADYDFILIDCPPALSTLTINAMTAADAVLVPVQCEFLALEGLSQLLQTISVVRSGLNPALEIQGVVLTMHDKRNKLSEQVEQEVRDHFGDTVYRTVIPRNVKLSEAPSFGMPALIYDTTCVGSNAYISLASEVLQRERHHLTGTPAS